jgi:hypothetical protein
MISDAYIDPGVTESACAFFVTRELNGVCFVSPSALSVLRPGDVRSALIEAPRIDGQTRGKDENDIVALGMAIGDLRGAIRAYCGVEAQLVERSKWKGQVPKPIHHSRVWGALTPPERATFAGFAGTTVEYVTNKIETACAAFAQHGRVVRYSWRAHNLLDAVGLGLWDLARIGRGGKKL